MLGHVVITADTTLRVSVAIFMTMVNRNLVKLRYHWGLRDDIAQHDSISIPSGAYCCGFRLGGAARSW